MERRLFLGLLPGLFLAPAWASEPGHAAFTGTWKQSNDRCLPKRTGDVTLRIEQHESTLVVETTAQGASGQPRHALQRYTTDGEVSVSTGADGDEFHTSIVWDGSRLVFSIEEHEDGRILLAKEIWTLLENDTTLQRERERRDGSGNVAPKQVLIYQRQSAPDPD